MNTNEGKAKIFTGADQESRLKGLRYTVLGRATTGENALDLVEQYQPGLVMNDL